MNSRERLRRCYFHEELDRPGVYSRTGFPANDPTYDRLKDYLAAQTDLKRDWNARQLESAYPEDQYTEAFSADFERRVAVLHTPAGDLHASWLVSLKGQPGMQETHFLKNRKDAEKYLSLPLPEYNNDVSGFFAAESAIGDRGIVQVGLGSNPGATVVRLFGSETFALMSVTDREIIHRLCEGQMKIIIARVKFLLERNLGPFFAMLGEEYLVPPLHGPKDFYDFNVKYDKPIIDLIHAGGGRIHIHSHGSVKAVFQGFLDLGADVLHPFEAPPMGDITSREAKALARGKLCLEGNIQISSMYEHTPEQLREETTALIQTAFADHQGLIVCPTASPYIRGKGEVCFPQYQAMIDTTLEWKA